MTSSTFRVLGVAGRLRRGSFNQALIETASELAPARLQIVPFGIEDIPLFNFDVEQAGDPEPVVRLKEAMTRTARAQSQLRQTLVYNDVLGTSVGP